MEIIEDELHADAFLAVTLGILVLFIGKRLNMAFAFLKDFSIPVFLNNF
jgi:ESS family glutamate:Na+ symporter